jgi:hypothetical protein
MLDGTGSELGPKMGFRISGVGISGSNIKELIILCLFVDVPLKVDFKKINYL